MSARTHPVETYLNVTNSQLSKLEQLRGEAKRVGERLHRHLGAYPKRDALAAEYVTLKAYTEVCRQLLMTVQFADHLDEAKPQSVLR